MTRHVLDRPESALIEWPFLADSVEKLSSAAASWSAVPAIEVTGSHFKLPFGVSLSFLAQV
ncbi:hypothetical protein ACEP3B_28700 [Pseudomonas aeruginosa]